MPQKGTKFNKEEELHHVDNISLEALHQVLEIFAREAKEIKEIESVIELVGIKSTNKGNINAKGLDEDDKEDIVEINIIQKNHY